MTASRDEPALFDSLRRLSGTALGIVHTRLALATLELDEARGRLFSAVLMAFAAVLLACAALVAFSVWLAFALWERSGPAIIVIIAAAYAAGAAWLLFSLRVRAAAAPPLLADTLAELKRDAQVLRGGADRHGR